MISEMIKLFDANQLCQFGITNKEKRRPKVVKTNKSKNSNTVSN